MRLLLTPAFLRRDAPKRPFPSGTQLARALEGASSARFHGPLRSRAAASKAFVAAVRPPPRRCSAKDLFFFCITRVSRPTGALFSLDTVDVDGLPRTGGSCMPCADERAASCARAARQSEPSGPCMARGYCETGRASPPTAYSPLRPPPRSRPRRRPRPRTPSRAAPAGIRRPAGRQRSRAYTPREHRLAPGIDAGGRGQREHARVGARGAVGITPHRPPAPPPHIHA